jgi:hypothetical protein
MFRLNQGLARLLGPDPSEWTLGGKAGYFWAGAAGAGTLIVIPRFCSSATIVLAF